MVRESEVKMTNVNLDWLPDWRDIVIQLKNRTL